MQVLRVKKYTLDSKESTKLHAQYSQKTLSVLENYSD